MGTTLTGTFISQTYDSLIKVTDNDNLTSTAKRLTDGLGNDSPLFLSTTKLGVGVTPTTTFQVAGNSQLGGNLTVTGNLIVQGTTTTVDTDTLSVKDPLIIVGSDNTSSDAVDLGFYGVYDTSGSLDLYAGLFRDASDAKFHLFKDLQTEPTTTVNKSGTGYTKAGLVIGGLEATTGSFTGNIEATSYIQSNNNFLTKGTLKFSNNADNSFINGFRRVSGADTLELLNISNINNSEGSGVTFGGTVTVSGGDITLGGTGRIQGIDTVSASTDAANKAYVDAQITAQDLDIAGDSGTGSVDLDSQTFTVAGGTNVTTSVSGQTVTINATGSIDGSGTANDVVMWQDSNTLTDAPIAISGNNATFAGNVNLGDSKLLNIGTGSDLNLSVDGTHSYIQNNTGTLHLMQNTDDGDMLFMCDDGSGGTTEYLRLDGGDVETVFTKRAKFIDNTNLNIGSSRDLQIFHDGTNSFIKNNTGGLFIDQELDDGDISFRSDNGSGGKLTYLFLDGSNTRLQFNTNLITGDNNKLVFGNSGDLEIYHDGANSFVQDTGTGGLFLEGNGEVRIRKSATSEIMAKFIADGAVELYHDNIKKLETTSTGISVTGATNRFVVDSSTASAIDIGFVSSARTIRAIETGGGNARPLTLLAQDFTFKDDSATRMTINSSGNVLLTSDGDATQLQIKRASSGQDNGLQLQDQNGNKHAIFNLEGTSTNNLQIASSQQILFHTNSDCGNPPTNERMRITAQGLVGINATSPNTQFEVRGAATTGSVGTASVARFGRPTSVGTSFDQYVDFKIGRHTAPGGAFQSFTRFDIDLRDDSTSTGNNTNIMTLLNNGNVGIGTNSPNAKTNIEDGHLLTSQSANTTQENILLQGAGFHIGSTLYGNVSIRSSYTNTNNSGTLNFYTAVSGTNTAERMRIDKSGNVGIGTTSPAQKLEIVNSGFAYIRLRSTASSFTGFDIGQHTGGSVFLNNRDNTSIVLMTNNTTALTINNSQSATFAGDITTSGHIFIPVAKNLYFGGGSHTYIGEDIDDRLRFFVGGAEFMRFTEDTSDTIQLFQDTTVTGELNVQDATHSTFRVKSGNNDNILFAQAIQSDNARVGTQTNTPLSFFTNSSERVRVTTSGLVGINYTLPSAKLHIETGADEGIRIHRTGTNANFGAIEFRNSDDSATNSRIGYNANELRLEATSTLKCITNSTDRLTINSSGAATFATSVQSPFFTSDGGRGFKQDSVAFVSTYSNGADANAVNDIGSTSNKWRDAYFSGQVNSATISTTGNATFAGQFVNITHSTNAGAGMGLNITNTNTSGNSFATINIAGANGTVNTQIFSDGSGTGGFGSAGSVIRTSTNHPIYIGTNSTTALTLDTSQNATFAGAVTVGTGTVAAANAAADDFVIKGPGTTATGMTISNTSDSGTGTIFFGDTTSSSAAGFRYNHNTGDMAISAEDNVTFDCDNVGIGTTSPGTKLDVAGSGKFQPGIADGDALVTIAQTNSNAYVHAGLKINAGNTNPFYIYQSGSSNTLRFNYNSLSDAGGQMVITDGGNVGIGATSPSYKLQVGGTAYINDTLYVNGATTIDADLTISEANGEINFTSGNGNIQTTTGSTSLVLGVNSSEKMRIHSSGNIGIGTTSPNDKLHIVGNLFIEDGSPEITFETGSSHYNWQIAAQENVDAALEFSVGSQDADASNDTFTPKMVIRQSGKVGIGTTSPSTLLHVGLNHTVGSNFASAFSSSNFFVNNGANGGAAVFQQGTASANLAMFGKDSSNTAISFFNSDLATNTSAVGSITTNSSATAFNTSSDYRLKEDLKDFTGLDLVNQIPVYDFKWKLDDTRAYGVLAHELQNVLPQAVYGEKDAKEMQGVDYSKIVPLLIKSIQELQKEIEILKNK